jgi:hypothetical protein
MSKEPVHATRRSARLASVSALPARVDTSEPEKKIKKEAQQTRVLKNEQFHGAFAGASRIEITYNSPQYMLYASVPDIEDINTATVWAIQYAAAITDHQRTKSEQSKRARESGLFFQGFEIDDKGVYLAKWRALVPHSEDPEEETLQIVHDLAEEMELPHLTVLDSSGTAPFQFSTIEVANWNSNTKTDI